MSSSPPLSTSRVAVGKMVADRVDREWCLFVDRDGVINRRIVGDYVRRREDFEWLPGARCALAELRKWVPHLVVVTNQQGVGKGLMSAEDLVGIHRHLQAELAPDSVAIDAFQVCPHLESAGCACRKPRPGLVLEWLDRHPHTDASLSVMVGDSPSDLEMAANVARVTGGCVSIAIGQQAGDASPVDAMFDSLWDFAIAVGHARKEEGK